jgi:hypothetical protein
MKSTLWVKRIVLVNGEQSGKGRPAKGVKNSRTCLYIPLKETFGEHSRATSERPYNPTKNADQRKQFKRTLIRALKPVLALEPVTYPEVADLPEPVVTVNVESTPVEVTA